MISINQRGIIYIMYQINITATSISPFHLIDGPPYPTEHNKYLELYFKILFEKCLPYLSGINVLIMPFRIITSLVRGRCGDDFKSVNFSLIVRIDFLSTTYEIALRWMPQNISDDESTLVQEMAWLSSGNKPLPHPMLIKSVSPYETTRPISVKKIINHNSYSYSLN